MTVAPWLVCGAVATAVAAGCGTSTFHCQSDDQCEGGTCLLDGFCGFPDDGCESGLRYGDLSGPLSGQCVPLADTDGTDGSTTAASTSSTATLSGSTSDTTTEPNTQSSSTEPFITTSATESSSGESSTGDPPIDPSLVLWIDFDGGEDVWLDDRSPYGNNGVCDDLVCPTVVEGVSGEAALFAGAHVVSVAPSLSLETPMGFTIAAWHLLAEMPDSQRAVITKAVGTDAFNSWELYYFTGPCLACPIFSMASGDGGGQDIQAPTALAPQEWVHLAATWDGSLMSLWVNGELVAGLAQGVLEMENQPVLIGADDDHLPLDYDGYFIGAIDEVRIYDRALDMDEILALAQLP